MLQRLSCTALYLAAAIGPWPAAAFRNCDVENSYAYLASTQYTVEEIEFDPVTAWASGTRTIYNYSNRQDHSFEECHVTYELSGSYAAGSGTFVMEGRRTNYSRACPPEMITETYPPALAYALQVDFGGDGATVVNLADNGDTLARGSWEAGRTVYKTPETCTLF